MGVVNMINDDIHRIIIDVKSITMESSLSVMDTMIDLIDKNDLITEYAENDIMNDIIMESMMIFMESKNRDRDKTPRNEISKWMESKGYWYTGDNPKKKKECMRMYHFLQQHKFDPKTETYESDIDDDKGGKKRIKLNIDKLYTQDGTKRIMSTLKGDNAYYNATRDDINIGSNLLKKKKQAISQGRLKHEEGHANDYDKWRKSIKDENIRNIRNSANQFINDTAKTGQFINSHDSDPDELYADLYSAKHARIRTKDRGKGKQATRAYMLKDLYQRYMSMSRNRLKNGNDAARELRTRRENQLKELDKKDKIYKRLKDLKGNITEKDVDTIFEICNDIKTDFTPPEISMASSIKNINTCKDNISKWKSELEDLKKQAADCDDIFVKDMKLLEIEDIEDLMDNSIKKINSIADDLRSKMKNLKNEGKDININALKGLARKNIGDKSVQDGVNEFLDKLIKHMDNEISIDKTILDDLDRAIKETKIVNDEGMEFSTALRYQYAKQFVKEYFKELYDNSNVFYD